MNILSYWKRPPMPKPQKRSAAYIPTAKAGGFTRRVDNGWRQRFSSSGTSHCCSAPGVPPTSRCNVSCCYYIFPFGNPLLKEDQANIRQRDTQKCDRPRVSLQITRARYCHFMGQYLPLRHGTLPKPERSGGFL